MLVLSRKREETIVIDGRITVKVVRLQGNTVRLGIEAPEGVSVWRSELLPPPMASGDPPLGPGCTAGGLSFA